MTVILFSFLMPKIFGFYLLELHVILNFIRTIFSGKINFLKFPEYSKNQKILKNYLFITLVFFVLKFIFITLSLIFNENLEKTDVVSVFVFECKMFLYFFIIPLIPFTTLSFKFTKYLFHVTILFFVSSFIIFFNTLRTSSLGEMIWKSNEFGNRFVGFTGSAITNNGIELIGSTANAIGVLYVLLFYIFIFGAKRNLIGGLICLLGCALTFSQSSLLILVMTIILHAFIYIRIPRTFVIISILVVFILLFLNFYFNINIFFRVSMTLLSIMDTGTIGHTATDRSTQWSYLFNNLSLCPSTIFTGQLLSFPNNCGKSAIMESYFMNVIKEYGIILFLLSFFQFYKLLQVLQISKLLHLTPFWVVWAVSNIFFNNTYQNDVILMTLLLLWGGSLMKENLVNN